MYVRDLYFKVQIREMNLNHSSSSKMPWSVIHVGYLVIYVLELAVLYNRIGPNVRLITRLITTNSTDNWTDPESHDKSVSY